MPLYSTCPTCAHSPLPEGARFCSSCGSALAINPLRLNSETGEQNDGRLQLNWRWFIVSVLATIALSVLLNMVFHWPVFLFGAFLPFAWQFSKRR